MRQIKGRRRQLLYRKEIAMEVYLGVAVSLCSVFLAIVLHEVAHGYAAYMLGDDTARRAGRLSLNPLNHIDPFGSVFLPLFLLWSGTGFLFGWAKPVPVSFYRLKKFPRDMLIVSGAGIAANLALALAAGLIFNLFPGIPGLLKLFLLYFVISNLVLECGAPVNIMFADTRDIGGTAFGQMVLQLPDNEEVVRRILAYADSKGLMLEEMKNV